MENFERYNPTRLIFGEDILDSISTAIAPYGNRILLVIGKQSARQNGLYARVLSMLNIAGAEHITIEGITINTDHTDVDAAIQTAKENHITLIIAIGGCATIDVAKAISIGYYSDEPIWDIFTGKTPAPGVSLPLISILTIASTGTAMNNKAVLLNKALRCKKDFCTTLFYPKISFLDPSYSRSVPANYTSYGIAIIISNALEQFFGRGSAPLSDYFTTDVIRLAIKHGHEVIENPADYQTRAHIMWLATTALNGTLSAGKNIGDWGAYGIANTLDALYNLPHGVSLCITHLAWLRYHQSKLSEKMFFLTSKVFEIGEDYGEKMQSSSLFADNLEQFYKSINIPVSLRLVNIYPQEKENILNNLKQNKVSGLVYKLNEVDYENILNLMW